MTRFFLILTLLHLAKASSGQITPLERSVLKQILKDVETCGKYYFIDKTDSLFINQFAECIKQDEIRFHEPEARKVSLTKTDKAIILKGLSLSKMNVWTDSNLLDNGTIIPRDSVFSVDYYIDSSCLLQLQQNDKPIKVFSFSKPIFFNDGNSFVIYVIEIGIHAKWKKIYYATTKLMLFHKNGNIWTKAGDLYNGFYCNG